MFPRLRLATLCCIATAVAGCATGTTRPLQTSVTSPEHAAPARPQVSLLTVGKNYNGTCTGGQRESNNCAHFLSDAFIRSGYEELLDLPYVTTRCRCGTGRVVRAQEMLKWFQAKAETFHAGIPEPGTGVWAMYQEKPGRRHVLIYDANTGKYYGTDNCVEWPVQWAYQW